MTDSLGIAYAIHNPMVLHDSCVACRMPFMGSRTAKMCPACRNGEPGRARARATNARTRARQRARLEGRR